MITTNQSPAVRNLDLPKGVSMKDLERVPYDSKDKITGYDYDKQSFDLWLTAGFGWVIPTLSIGGKGRTYAIATGEGATRRITKGAQVRCGHGPHILAQLTVYLRKSTATKLQPFLDLRDKGAVDANVTRDRISSRRAQGQVMRAEGRSHWRWDV